LTGHHAGHAGTGLANAHVATWRDFDTIRAHAGGRESLVDEMAGAAQSGLLHAQVLLAREIAPGDQGVIDAGCDPVRLRRALIAAVRGGHG
ncbi:MAG: hypothetical protein OEM97_09750, partial [Acidimicrobiia bacterium]|nr:hypothetical protein [Acidimicrobiia bacterium]